MVGGLLLGLTSWWQVAAAVGWTGGWREQPGAALQSAAEYSLRLLQAVLVMPQVT